MLLDLSPLKNHRDFRLLYAGQTISLLGSMMTYVAVPFQVFALTESSLWVGLLGSVQLVPLALAALFGGVLADSLDRRRMLVASELALALGSLGLAINASVSHPSAVFIFVVSGAMSGVNGFHRPALEAMTPRLLESEELPAAAALGSLRSNAAAIGGPAVAGLVVARFGLPAAYIIDVVSFGASVACLAALVPPPMPVSVSVSTLRSLAEGLTYAARRPELIGTYVVDIVAMTFAMPLALFPHMAQAWGGASAAGWLYAAMPMGSLAVTLVSGWASRVTRHGAAVVLAATLWGIAVIGLGFSTTLIGAVVCLAVAGAADMVSGVFRQTIWNQTIPDRLRGRLAGVEMISYMTGPLIGNARAGAVASLTSDAVSIVSGGVLCAAGVLACVPLLPKFWRYRAEKGAGPVELPMAVEKAVEEVERGVR